MRKMTRVAKGILAAVAAGALALAPAWAEDSREDQLFAELAKASEADVAARFAGQIIARWNQSGSAVIDLLYARAEQSLELGDPITAAEHLTAAIDHAPAFLAAYTLRGQAYYQSGQIGPALDDLAHVLKEEPRQFDALAGFAAISEEIGREEMALAAYRQLAQIYPAMEGLQEALARLERQIDGITL